MADRSGKVKDELSCSIIQNVFIFTFSWQRGSDVFQTLKLKLYLDEEGGFFLHGSDERAESVDFYQLVHSSPL